MNSYLLLVPLAVLALSRPARASEASEFEAKKHRDAGGFHADAEIDPTAYVLSGYSLHVGLGWNRVRFDLGAFALDVPTFVHGNDDFDVSFHGYGAKLQYFLFAEQRGLFVGIDGALTRSLVRLTGTDLAALDTQVNVGMNAGYRFELGAGFYVTPWLGVGTLLGAEDVTLGGETFEPSTWLVFPAIHVGYRFR